MTAPDIIKNLVERFEQHRDSYRSRRYNETQLQRELELNNFSRAEGVRASLLLSRIDLPI